MTKLLNRIALLLSILMWFFITFSLYWISWEFNNFYWDETFSLIIVSIIIWLIFKKLFLSKSFIISRIDFFSKQIESKLKNTEITKDIWNESEKVSNNEKNNTYNMVNPIWEIKSMFSEKLEKVQEIKTNLKTNISPKKENIIFKNIKNFFKENLLAKIGSILVFLWVLFLFSLVWNVLPSLWKIIIGFIIWFWVYFTWVILDTKWLKWESKILIWTWILINFLVILGGKFVLEWNVNSTDFFSTWITFMFLILNTIFWVVSSIVYKSKTMLLFSFIFAYINPFLIWWNSTTPYTLIWYSSIVSIWAIIIWNRENSNLLKISAFILWNILFLAAPFNSEIWWIAKFIASSVLSLWILYNLYLNNYKRLNSIFITSFIFLILNLIYWSDNSLINNNISFITYLLSILVFFFVWITLFLKNVITSLVSIIFFPILILLWLLFVGDLYFIEISLWSIIIAYLIWFGLISSPSNNNINVSNGLKYFFFVLLWIFIFIVNSFLSFSLNGISFISFISIILVSFVFLISSYLFSKRTNLSYLYTIWTIWTVFILLPVINLDLTILLKTIIDPIYEQNELLKLIKPFCISSIVLFWLVNTFWPFINKKLIKEKTNIKNLVIWLIIWALFLWWELYKYWLEYFPGISLWYAFAWLAIYYFILSFVFISNIWFENIKNEISYKNSLFGYLFISISIFSLSIALIFSNSPEVVSLIWLFEATILFYFFSKTKETKIFNAAILLFIIWIVKLLELKNYVETWDLVFIVPIALIIISFVLNIKYIDFLENKFRKNIHDIIHIIWMIIIATIIEKIVPQTNHGWSTLWIASFVGISGLIYNSFSSKILKTFFVLLVALFTLNQIESFNYITYRLQEDNLRFLISLQYLSTIIIIWIIAYWNKFSKEKIHKIILNIMLGLYLLVIISTYIYDIFNNTFAITIFWWIISIILLINWISKDKIKLRTVWLYLLTLVLGKIFLYDIWYGLDNAVSRVVVFIILWVLLIVVSTRYSKKYGNNLVWEFNFKNLSSQNKIKEVPKRDTIKKSESIKNNTKVEISNEDITKQIKNIDISWISMISFKIDSKIAFSTKSKNIIQIVIYVLKKTWLKQFEAWELIPFYDFVTSHYISDLNTRDLSTVKNAFKTFVEKGWEVIIKKE